MHILLIHQAFASLDEPGGTRHHELARHLADRGHRVTIIASPVSYLTGMARGEHIPWVEKQVDGEHITILRAYTYQALHRSFVHRVFSFLSFMFSSFIIGLGVREVDLVWGTSPPIFQGATAWALSRLKHAPFLFEVRYLWPAFAVAVGVLRNPLLIRASEWLEGFLYRNAKTVMVNSPGFITHIQERGARRIALVPNGSDTHMFRPQDEEQIRGGIEFRHSHGFQDRFVAMYAGAHGLSNDLGVVLEAARLLTARPDIAIVLLGDGKDKPSLQKRAIELGLSNLYFLPPLSKTEMPAALAAADACIAILKPIEMYKTVYPNKVFDYMAAGKPVILAIGGVIEDVIREANGGIPIEPGNPSAMAEAICLLADDRQRGIQMGQSARKYIETHFDRSQLADELATLMHELAYPSPQS
jgi:glycosyltransferase involved in cell wall biosynthesis